MSKIKCKDPNIKFCFSRNLFIHLEQLQSQRHLSGAGLVTELREPVGRRREIRADLLVRLHPGRVQRAEHHVIVEGVIGAVLSPPVRAGLQGDPVSQRVNQVDHGVVGLSYLLPQAKYIKSIR